MQRRHLLWALPAAVLLLLAGWFAGSLIFTFSDDTAGLDDPAPAFRLAGLDGQWHDPQRYAGEVLVLNFWATWCAPCREEMPLLNRFYQQHRQQGVRVLGIALDDAAAVREFVTELGIDYPIAVGAGDVMETQRAYGNQRGALPYTAVIGRDGRIRWRHWGVVDEALLQQEVLALL